MRAWLSRGVHWGLAMLLWLALPCAFADQKLLTLNSGTVTTTVDGLTQVEPLRLPYHWDRQQAGRPGVASFELPFTLDRVPEGPWGIFIARIGTSFEIQLNGELLQVNGSLTRSDGGDYAKVPRFIAAPAWPRLSSGRPARFGVSCSPTPTPRASPVRCCCRPSAWWWASRRSHSG
jgi:hypothetical protein